MTIGLPLTIPNSFVRTARWFGDGEAVVDSATRLTYAELDRLSRRAVALFASLGAVPMALHTRESAATLAAVCRRMGARLLVYDAAMEDLAAGIAAAHPQP